MKSLLNKKISLGLTTALAAVMPITLTNLTSCSQSNSIQFANYESYMNDRLMNHLSSEYGVQFQYFTVAEMIETKFERFYDICVPPGYELVSLYTKGLLHKIDWAKFDIKDSKGNKITNSTQARGLFVTGGDIFNDMNDNFRAYLKKMGDPQADSFDVLDYGIPYFAQQFMFGYKGEKLDFYKYNTTNKTEDPTWLDIFYTISPANPNCDSRFKKASRTNYCSMLDDAKTMYDIARIMETINDPSGPTNVIPEGSTVDSMIETLSTLTDMFKGDQWFVLNTDSGIISRNFANRVHSNPCVFSWSGDMLYAALGAEEFNPYSAAEMHIQKPSVASLDEIEFLVINKKDEKDSSKLNEIYNIVKEVCLDGCDLTPDANGIAKTDADGNYVHWSMANWDTVNYTPMLQNIYQYTIGSEEYWSDYLDKLGLEGQVRQDTLKLYQSIITPTVEEVKSIYGKTLTPLQNSDTHWAWMQAKQKL